MQILDSQNVCVCISLFMWCFYMTEHLVLIWLVLSAFLNDRAAKPYNRQDISRMRHWV